MAGADKRGTLPFHVTREPTGHSHAQQAMMNTRPHACGFQAPLQSPEESMSTPGLPGTRISLGPCTSYSNKGPTFHLPTSFPTTTSPKTSAIILCCLSPCCQVCTQPPCTQPTLAGQCKAAPMRLRAAGLHQHANFFRPSRQAPHHINRRSSQCTPKGPKPMHVRNKGPSHGPLVMTS